MKITQETVIKTAKELEEYTGKPWNTYHTYLRLWRRYNREFQEVKYKPRDLEIERILTTNLDLQ